MGIEFKQMDKVSISTFFNVFQHPVSPNLYNINYKINDHNKELCIRSNQCVTIIIMHNNKVTVVTGQWY